MGMIGKGFTVKEQTPMEDCIFCEVDSDINLSGNMYFICDFDRYIIQWFEWMEGEEETERLKELGYKFRD